jgi:GGDEF domain-containing protein
MRFGIPVIPAVVGYERLTAEERRGLRGVATRQALIERLHTVGDVAPSAPLSLVAVEVTGLSDLDDPTGEEGSEILAAVGIRIAELTRPLDLVGRLTGTSFGVLLQGAGAVAGAAVAARLQHHLETFTALRAPLDVVVTVATGTGESASALPVAALDALKEATIGD